MIVDSNEKRLLPLSEFCKEHGICRATAYAEARRGRLILRKLAGKTVVAREDAEAWRGALPVAGFVGTEAEGDI